MQTVWPFMHSVFMNKCVHASVCHSISCFMQRTVHVNRVHASRVHARLTSHKRVHASVVHAQRVHCKHVFMQACVIAMRAVMQACSPPVFPSVLGHSSVFDQVCSQAVFPRRCLMTPPFIQVLFIQDVPRFNGVCQVGKWPRSSAKCVHSSAGPSPILRCVHSRCVHCHPRSVHASCSSHRQSDVHSKTCSFKCVHDERNLWNHASVFMQVCSCKCVHSSVFMQVCSCK